MPGNLDIAQSGDDKFLIVGRSIWYPVQPASCITDMSKKVFTAAERVAIWSVHGEKCYLCGKPIDLLSMEVDHVIPETLLTQPDRLSDVLASLGRKAGFDLNSPSNWMPSCGPCNNLKRSMQFDPSLKVQAVLQLAETRASEVQAVVDEEVSSNKLTRAINTLERARQNGTLGQLLSKKASVPDWLEPLISTVASHRNPALQYAPIVLAPMLEIIGDNNGVLLIKGPYGVGALPANEDRDASWRCSHCGSFSGWSGARCVGCGQMDED